MLSEFAEQHNDTGCRERDDEVQHRSDGALREHELPRLDIRHTLHAVVPPDHILRNIARRADERRFLVGLSNEAVLGVKVHERIILDLAHGKALLQFFYLHVSPPRHRRFI